MRPEPTKGNFIPSISTTSETAPLALSAPTTQPLDITPSSASNSGANLLIIGSIAVDYTCTYTPPSGVSASSSPSLSTSNPTSIAETTGGVANNVYTAAQLYLHGSSTSQSLAVPLAAPKVHLVSTLASDLTGKSILSGLQSRGVDTSGIYIRNPAEGIATATYIALNDASGGLFTAAADMRIVEEIPLSHIRQQIECAQPSWVCVDGNMSPEGITEVLRSSASVGAKVAFEPTSMQKSTRLFVRCGSGKNDNGSGGGSGSSITSSKLLGLGIYPHHNVHIATPNIYELKSMWEFAKQAEYFESMEWFQVIDSMNIDTMFRNCELHPLLPTLPLSPSPCSTPVSGSLPSAHTYSTPSRSLPTAPSPTSISPSQSVFEPRKVPQQQFRHPDHK